MNKVLIFGISGFVGPYLAKEFQNAGYQVCGSDICDECTIEGVEFEKADLLDMNSVTAVIRKFEPNMIINLAAVSSVGLSWKIPQTTISVNVVGALNILE